MHENNKPEVRKQLPITLDREEMAKVSHNPELLKRIKRFKNKIQKLVDESDDVTSITYSCNGGEEIEIARRRNNNG